MSEPDNKKDLKFLKEIRDKIVNGLDRNDPERIKYALKMVNDWIDEIECEISKTE